MSYRTTPNMKKIIAAHNSNIFNQKSAVDPPVTVEKKRIAPAPQMVPVEARM